MSRVKHIGSRFDDYLEEQGELEQATAIAIKRVIAWQLEQAMNNAGINKSNMAKRMRTSRTVIDRLLDSTDTGLTLDTITKAALVLGCRVKLDLVREKS